MATRGKDNRLLPEGWRRDGPHAAQTMPVGIGNDFDFTGGGDTVHVAYGYGLFTGGLGAHYGAERLGCTVIPMSGGQTEKQVQLINDFRPDIIMVTPSYFCNILEEQRRQGIDPRQTSLRIGIFGAEPWTGQMRADIEAALAAGDAAAARRRSRMCASR